MTEPLLPPSFPPTDPSAPTVKLWTPRAISVITFLLGYPGGAAMAIINWIRMGLKKKAINHLIAFLVGTAALAAALAFSTGGTSRYLGLVVNVGIMLYLSAQMTTDIAEFKAANPNVEDAHWSSGCLLGLLGIALLLAISFSVAPIFVFAGVPIPE